VTKRKKTNQQEIGVGVGFFVFTFFHLFVRFEWFGIQLKVGRVKAMLSKTK
jgi:hypothetical protein